VPRSPVDVVIPFDGTHDGLRELIERLCRLEHDLTATDDSIVVVDNRSTPLVAFGSTGGIQLLSAPTIRSSYHARNAGARPGRAPWLLFLDADVEWTAGLLDAYLDPEPADRTAVLAGAIEDAPLPDGRRATVAERYAAAARPMSASMTLDAGRRPYAQTANCMVRRAAFEAVGGFTDGIRSGGDADLCFRLADAGWELECRDRAKVVHRNRRALRSLLGQKARHGGGAAWLERRYPGSFPRWGVPRLAAWSLRQAAGAPRSGEPSVEMVQVLLAWSFELGRLLSNEARAR
jgi:GT2 family glycosyltransferase